MTTSGFGPNEIPNILDNVSSSSIYDMQNTSPKSVEGIQVSDRLTCPECHRSFGRIEHLKRHLRGHKEERPFECSYCQKAFYRVDSLQRHENIHKEPNRKRIRKGARACLECAAARTKCSGDLPCKRCQTRSIECRFPDGRTNLKVENPMDSLKNSEPTSMERNQQPILRQLNTSQGVYIDSEPRSNGEPSLGIQPSSRAPLLRNQNRNTAQAQHRSPPHFSDMTAQNNVGYQLSPQVPESQGMSQNAVLQKSLAPAAREAISTIQPQNQLLGGQSRSTSSYSMDVESNPGLPRSERFLANSCASNSPALVGSEQTSPAGFWDQNNFSTINWLSRDDASTYRDNLGAAYDSLNQNPHSATLPRSTGQPSTSLIGLANSANSASPNPTNRSDWLHTIIGHQAQQTASSDSGPRSTSSDSQTDRGTGRYYVDGDGARLPRIKRRKITTVVNTPAGILIPSINLQKVNNDETLGFPRINQILSESSESIPSTVRLLDQSVYEQILECFNRTCNVTSNFFCRFGSLNFPSFNIFSRFIQLYLESFQPLLPFIHPSTINLAESHWLLALAMAAIGCHYAEMEESARCVLSMHEFLRRAIHVVSEGDAKSKPDPLLLIQVKILNSIGMLYCQDERLIRIAQTYHSDLVTYCQKGWKKSALPLSQIMSNSLETVERDWKTWREIETRRRTGYCIWLLDCMWAYQFEMSPLLSLEDAKVPLPCQEVVWEADNAMSWRQILSYSDPSPTLTVATETIYLEKRLQPTTGEFSRILLIHALIRRMWEVERYLRQPLSRWTPTAEKQDRSILGSPESIWLPAIPIFSRWRNSTCDCLDILHWNANSVIGATSGMEHPTVLHLHLSRIILLPPIRNILSLALSLTRETLDGDQLDPTTDRTFVQRWAAEDGFKARLAIIHAGAIFWHVRHYSANGFYEPTAVLLATLTLWAYGSFTQSVASPATTGTDQGSDSQLANDSDSELPTLVQLDRPIDDELVQLFVQRGNSMRAIITGVGNLCGPKGPERVLLEGVKLLAGLVNCWGIAQKGIRVLTSLARLPRNKVPS